MMEETRIEEICRLLPSCIPAYSNRKVIKEEILTEIAYYTDKLNFVFKPIKKYTQAETRRAISIIYSRQKN